MSRATPLCVLTVLFLSWGSVAAVKGLKLVFDGGERNVDVRLLDGQPYLKLKDLARAFDLEVRRIDRATVRITGPRGTLQLTGGKALIRGGHTDLLLDSPVWQRSRSDWWVPRGFLDIALAGILEHRLIDQGPNRYRAEALLRRLVNVDIRNFPDHVSFAFRPSGRARGKVREFEAHLEIRFDGTLIEPRVYGGRPRTEMVRRLEFGEQDGLGAFHLAKGREFGFFRVTEGSSGELLLDVYGLDPVTSARGPAGEEPYPVAAEPTAALPQISEELPVEPEAFDIVIDPSSSEKPGWGNGLSLELARRIAGQLSARGVRVALTRDRDVLVPRSARSAMANRVGAKAFVGLGVVQLPEQGVFSSQTYVFGDPFHTEELARTSGTGLDRWEHGYLRRRFASWQLALSVQQQLNLLNEDGGRPIEAPVAVLEAVLAPSILIEVQGRPESVADTADRIATAIARGLKPVLR